MREIGGPMAHTSIEPGGTENTGYLVGAGRPGSGGPMLPAAVFGPVAGLRQGAAAEGGEFLWGVGAVHYVGEVLHLLGKELDTTGLPEERYS